MCVSGRPRNLSMKLASRPPFSPPAASRSALSPRQPLSYSPPGCLPGSCTLQWRLGPRCAGPALGCLFPSPCAAALCWCGPSSPCWQARNWAWTRRTFAAQTHFLGDIFFRLIRMIVAPLIFGGIVTGIAGHNELRGVGRVALKSIVFFEVVTTFGLILGASPSTSRRPESGVTLPAVDPGRRRPPHLPKAGSRFCSTFFRRTSPRPSPRIRFSRLPSSRCSSARRWPRCPSRSAPLWSACCSR